MPTTKGRFLPITGVPCTGKSCDCGHLRDAHGFYVVLTDCEPSFINEAVARTAGLVDRFLKQHANVAIEWGFHTKFLQQALDLGRQGARLVWFAGDAARARSGRQDSLALDWSAASRERFSGAALSVSFSDGAIQIMASPGRVFQTVAGAKRKGQFPSSVVPS